MNTIEFLEKMATTTHYSIELGKLINNQPLNIKNAYRTQNTIILKRHFGETQFIANHNEVVSV